MAVSVSLINMKGGVGKTTLAAQLAHACNRKGLRTLAIDLDPQANLSQALLRPQQYVRHLRGRKPTVVQLFEQYAPATDESASPRPVELHEIILRNLGYSGRATLDLIPSRLELSHTLKNPYGKERRVARALTVVADDYDLMLIDCAPTESVLTEAAYHASRHVLVPVKPEFLATIGLPLLARSIRDFKYENSDHALDICGIVFNHSSAYAEGPAGHPSGKSRRRPGNTAGMSLRLTCGTRAPTPRPRARGRRSGEPVMPDGMSPRSFPISWTSSCKQSAWPGKAHDSFDVP